MFGVRVNGVALTATILAAAAAGLLWCAPSIGGRAKGPRYVTLLLGLDAGAVLLTGIALAAAAGRSWMLVGDPADPAREAHAMLQVSRLDGDGDFFLLLIVVIGLLTMLATTVIGTAARSVAVASPGDRAVVMSVLGLQVLLGLGAVGHLLLVAGGPLDVVLIAHLPLTIAALVLYRRPRPTAARR